MISEKILHALITGGTLFVILGIVIWSIIKPFLLWIIFVLFGIILIALTMFVILVIGIITLYLLINSKKKIVNKESIYA